MFGIPILFVVVIVSPTRVSERQKRVTLLFQLVKTVLRLIPTGNAGLLSLLLGKGRHLVSLVPRNF